MRYLKFSRGPGSALVFRMKTPSELIGQPKPITGKPFGKEITIGLGTRNVSEPCRKRDVLLGQITALSDGVRNGGTFSLRAAEEWAKAISDYEAVATGDEYTDPADPRDFLESYIERHQRRERASEAEVDRFVKVVLGKGYPLDEALARYLEERKPGNRLGLKPLRTATMKDVRTAVQYLKDFAGQDGDALCLQDIDTKKARQFRYEFLPKLTSARAPHGLSAKTAAKHITLLSGLWEWARERGFLADDYGNPWQMGRGVPKSKHNEQDSRSLFTADQVTALFTAYPQGNKLGDIMRLALLTGCRSDELATLSVDAVEKEATGFRIRAGKTENAARYVPLMEPGTCTLPKGAGSTCLSGLCSRVFSTSVARSASPIRSRGIGPARRGSERP